MLKTAFCEGFQERAGARGRGGEKASNPSKYVYIAL